MGARVIGEEVMLRIVEAFFSAPYEGVTAEGARHGNRVGKILKMEEEF